MGPIIGAAFFTIVPEVIRELAHAAGLLWLAEGRFMLFGVFIILLMVFLPEGVVTRTLQDTLANKLYRSRINIFNSTGSS
ncbi:MAG: hypothetical protein CMM44_09460 [Rhodospirillaceae bacterium]|nr:hypothetical protein [Rhodospirillaceae bacterium]|tara:strand:- start:4589 stop:4828 length:240 start_codon:yes stop_codon:yes gene_type:complete